MVRLTGYLGALCLALCALPLLLHTIRVGNANDVEPNFLALWLTGEILMMFHTRATKASLPVQINYIANAAMVGVIGCYKWL